MNELNRAGSTPVLGSAAAWPRPLLIEHAGTRFVQRSSATEAVCGVGGTPRGRFRRDRAVFASGEEMPWYGLRTLPARDMRFSMLTQMIVMPGTGPKKVSEVADFIEKLAKDPTTGLDELSDLVGAMEAGTPARSAKEVKQAVEILNEDAPWTVEFLGKVKKALKDQERSAISLRMRSELSGTDWNVSCHQGLDDISKLVICPSPPEHKELQRLKEEVNSCPWSIASSLCAKPLLT